jgi:predicted lipoprotein with Yx(FWY)xxD motif
LRDPRRELTMIRSIRPLLAAAGLTAALAACGGGGGSSGAPSTAAGGAGSGTGTVAVADVKGVGNVLVDAAGLPLYVSDQEASGTVQCTGGCTSFWKPVAASTAPTSPGAVTLGVTKRPDGTSQVTVSGRPLYTFAQDSRGTAHGNGFSDDFDGHHFTWHVVMADGTVAAATGGATPTTTGGAGGGNGGYGGSGGGYGGYGG